ncbi:MAG: hypothetical protein GXX99_05440 [Clostridiales bacterium]|nr:hypothetical protein [Clostridiales bacterium]
MRRGVLALLLLGLLAGGPLPARALEADPALTERLYEGLYQNFGGEAFEQALPPEARGALPDQALIRPGKLAEAFSLRNLIDRMSGGLYKILRAVLADFAKVMLLVMVFVLASALGKGVGADFAQPAFNLVAVLSVSVAVYGIMRQSMDSCVAAIESSTRLMEVGVPVLLAASAASGKVLSSLVLPGAFSAGITLIAKLNSSFFLPVLSIYFALALASSISGSVSLKSLCKVFRQAVTFGMGLLTTVMAGLLSLQRVVTAASDSVATDAAKFALGSVIPVVGGILTDALGTVLGCIRVIRSSVGAVGIFVLLIILLPVLIRVLLYSSLFKLTSAVAGMFGEGGVPEFLSAVSDVWSIMAALTACQGFYLITAVAMIAS